MPRIRPLSHVVPLLALAALSLAGWSVARTHEPRTRTLPPLPPAVSPFAERVAAVGLIEPASETISVVPEIAGVVRSVRVEAGDRVAADAVLFALDDRSYRATLERRSAEVAAAAARVDELDANLILQSARIDGAAAGLRRSQAEHARAVADRDRYARLARRDFASAQRHEAATADARKAEADRGSAEAELASARAELGMLRAQRMRAAADHAAVTAAFSVARVDLDRTSIRAPIAGEVLAVDVRVGEWAQAGIGDQPPIRLGVTEPLHVRVDVDEADAWRVGPGAGARVQLRGNPAIMAAAAFVRIEPMVRPKRSLTSVGAERTDTRVMQVIYRVDPASFAARVGQQVDVFIEAAAAPAS